MKLSRYHTLLLLVCYLALLTGCPPPENKPAPVPDAVRTSLRDAATAGKDGDDFQMRGDLNSALEKYEDVVSSGNEAIRQYEGLGTSFEQRHWLAYFLPAQGHYDSARLQMALQYSTTEVNRHLQAGYQAISSAISLDQVAARRGGNDRTSNTWKLFYLRAGISSLLADLTAARKDYEQVARLNPGFRPAIDQIAYIDYLEGRNSSDCSPGGINFPDKRLLSTKTKGDLILLFSKYVFKDYAEEIGLAKNVWDELMK